MNFPPMNRPYRSSILTMSRASRAGAYSHAVVIGAFSARLASFVSVNGEVVRVLVSAGSLLADLHEHIVQERRRADPVTIRREPRDAEGLVDLHEVLHRLLRLADPARDLHADDATGLLEDVADDLEHAERDRERRIRRGLAGRGLDEIGAAGDREERCATHVVVRPELAGLEDHLQVRAAGADLLRPHDLVVDLRVPTREEGAAVDDHVDLVNALLHDLVS